MPATNLGGNAAVNAPAARSTGLSRGGIFTYDLLVLLALIIVAAVQIRCPQWLGLSVDAGTTPDGAKATANLYLLAVECMWFGCLGGVIISLKGIYDHSGGTNQWDNSYNLWHLGRPVSGAIAGLMTVVLLKAINSTNPAEPIAFSAAFIFGTQERRFFNFLYEVARLIVQVPEQPKEAGLRVTAVKPSEGAAGGLFMITGSGLAPTATVKLGAATADKLVVSADGSSAAGIIPARPAGSDTVDVVVANSASESITLPGKFKFSG